MNKSKYLTSMPMKKKTLAKEEQQERARLNKQVRISDLNAHDYEEMDLDENDMHDEDVDASFAIDSAEKRGLEGNWSNTNRITINNVESGWL